jgi:hypothetical protein
MRRAAATAYLASWAVVLGALGGEVALRWQRARLAPEAARFASANAFLQGPGLGVSRGLWEVPNVAYRPGSTISFTLDERLHEVRINSRGFRTREFAVPKPAGTVRVACVGASTTFHGFDNDSTYPAELERRLRELRPDLLLEVLNLGISGTGSDYWLGRFDELLALEPDIVVQYNAVNDFVLRYLPEWRAAGGWRPALHGRSLVWDRLVPLPGGDFETATRRTIEHHLSLWRACREHGIRYVTATFGAPDPASGEPAFAAFLDAITRDWTGGAVQHYRQYERLLADYNARLEAAAREGGVALAPAAAAMRDAKLYLDICHLKPRGIRKLADAFAEPVAALLPPS